MCHDGAVDGLTFISSLASSLAWPAIALVVVLVFRTELADLIKRLRKGKIAGLELEAEVGEKIENRLRARVEAQPPTTFAQAGLASAAVVAHGPSTANVAAADELPSITESVDARVTRAASFTADAVLASLPRASTADELADGVARYVEIRTTPHLRSLSPQRIDVEKELFGAVLELQTLRSNGAKPADPARLAVAIDVIRTFWARPEVLSDEGVANATALVRAVMGEMSA
jgi:hypothetical protein